jgi:hypothetical protein
MVNFGHWLGLSVWIFGLVVGFLFGIGCVDGLFQRRCGFWCSSVLAKNNRI